MNQAASDVRGAAAAFVPPYPSGLPVGEGWRAVGATSEVRFPYDGSLVALAPSGDAAAAEAAAAAAASVAREVGRLASHVRRTVLTNVAAWVAEVRHELEELLVMETGKPLVDCRVEVARTQLTWQTAAEEVARLHGETVPLDLLPSGQGLIGWWTRRPAGPVLGIAGYNYPLLLASHKIAPALAAGCPVVCKPAPATPLATLWMVHATREALAAAGAPRSAVQLVTGDVEVSSQLVRDPRMAVVSFTGSAAVGHQIARDAAPRKALLELGSNAALVVAADADLEAAADAVVRGGYYASGQACIAVQRVLLEEEVREDFLALLAKKVSDVRVGDPREDTTRVSALIDERSTDRVTTWVAEAVAAGATLVHGGGTVDLGDGRRAIEPTVLLDVPNGVAVWDEEVFGPVVCVRSVADVDTAFAAVNRSRYGLHASVFTRSLATTMRAIDELDVGGVVVNEVPGFRSDVMPYGGVKDSGIGREGPRFAIEEMTVTRMAVVRPS